MGTNLMAPGSTVICAAAICCAIGKTLESAILMLPPESGVGVTSEKRYANGDGTWPRGSSTAVALDEGDSDGKMYSSDPGIWSKADMLVWKFFASTSLGMCAVQSVS